jgi:hypothetical protein
VPCPAEVTPAVSRRLGPSKSWTPASYVRDHNGQALAYVYFEDEPGRRSAAKSLSKDEARRIAANFPKLPQVLHQDLAAQRLWGLVDGRGSGDDGYGLGPQDPPFPSRSAKHCSNVAYRHCAGVSGL